MRIRLKTRIQLLFATLLLALGVCVAIALSILSNSAVSAQIRQSTESAKNLLSSQMLTKTEQLRSQACLIAELPSLKSLVLQNVDQRTVDDWAGEYVLKTSADDLVLTSGTGKMLGQGSRFAGQYTVHDLPGLKDALNGTVWTGVVNHEPCPRYGVTIPIRNAGFVIGTLTVFQAVDSRTANDLRNILGQHVAFVCGDKVVGSSMPASFHFKSLPLKPTIVDLEDGQYVAVYSPLPRTSMSQKIGFISLKNYDEIAGPYRQLYWAFVGALALGVGFASLASRRLAKNITGPLDEVVTAAETLQRGEWPEEMAVKRTDEIGLLQTIFNDTAQSLRASRERLLVMIDLDPLTDLYNHSRFLKQLEHEAGRAAFSGEDLTLVLIDLDNFAKYNETEGRDAGDRALAQTAEIIRELAPELATCARYGGEEFAIVVPSETSERVIELAGEMLTRIRAEFISSGLTASVGCARFNPEKQNAGGFMLSAELCLNVAKQQGKNRVCTSDQAPETPYPLNDLANGDLATILALAAAVDAKDSYTQGHSERVAEYAYDLAVFTGISEKEAKLIYRAGTLHDVGKIGVPDAILKKPGRLTPEEEATMQTHPALGEVIVRKVPQLADTLPGVRSHHERWDGNGYPDGLKGERIPRIARYLAIADTFDAMTSDRPYRKGMPADVALTEIERNAGLQFDPELALAFTRMMRRGGLKAA